MTLSRWGGAAILIAVAAINVAACGGSTFVPARAVLYGAYQNPDDVTKNAIGRMIPISDGTLQSVREALSAPQTLSFDGATHVDPYEGNPFQNDRDAHNASLGFAAKASESCSGSLGVSFKKDSISNAKLNFDHIATLNTEARHYTSSFADCCQHPNASCLQWVITSMYHGTVEFDVDAETGSSAGGDVSCTPPATSAPSAAPAGASSAAAAPSPSASASTQTTVPATPTEKGVAIKASFDGSNAHKAHITSTGWNVIEVIPFRQACQDWQRACRTGDAGQRASNSCPN